MPDGLLQKSSLDNAEDQKVQAIIVKVDACRQNLMDCKAVYDGLPIEHKQYIASRFNHIVALMEYASNMEGTDDGIDQHVQDHEMNQELDAQASEIETLSSDTSEDENETVEYIDHRSQQQREKEWEEERCIQDTLREKEKKECQELQQPSDPLDQLFSDEDALKYLKFSKSDLRRLAKLLEMNIQPPPWGGDISGPEALAILLFRSSETVSLDEEEYHFGRSKDMLRHVINVVIAFLCRKVEDKVNVFDNNLREQRVKLFNDAIRARADEIGSHAFDDVCGFVSTMPVSRRTQSYAPWYDGPQEFYSSQVVTTPDGIASSCVRPRSSNGTNPFVFYEVLHRLKVIYPYKILGDSEYEAVFNELQKRHIDKDNLILKYVTDDDEANEVLVVNEWMRQSLRTESPRVFSVTLPLEGDHLHDLFYIGVFLSNCRTCLRGGNRISDYFHVAPPTIEEYINS